MANSMVDLFAKQGQAPWVDFIQRKVLHDAGLKPYVEIATAVGTLAGVPSASRWTRLPFGIQADKVTRDLERIVEVACEEHVSQPFELRPFEDTTRFGERTRDDHEAFRALELVERALERHESARVDDADAA